MPKQKADRIVSFLNEFCIIEEYDKLKTKICRDKDDDEILGLAKSSEAQYIISGDQDMLILEQFEITKIVSPRQFWEIAKQSAT
jgi:putative PIN family toxin of toxin-antitoxin system